MALFLSSLRIVIVSWLICVIGYAALILGVGQVFTPRTAQGSLIVQDGRVIGSTQIAQAFTAPGYFWPRPSAVDYNAEGAGGSNKSPTSTDVADRGAEIVTIYGATPENLLPPDLATASGAGLDPHVSLEGALYQAPRVASARGMSEAEVRSLVERNAFSPGGPLTRDRIVNVLLLNRALDSAGNAPPA